MENVVSKKSLIEAVGIHEYRELKIRGVLQERMSDDGIKVLLSSVPIRYRRKLASARH